MLKEMKALETYSKEKGLEFIINGMGEKRYTSPTSINFPNGWRVSIVNSDREIVIKDGKRKEEPLSDKKYSVAMCNYDGYFDWQILNNFGGINGRIFCDTEDEIIKACEIIRTL